MHHAHTHYNRNTHRVPLSSMQKTRSVSHLFFDDGGQDLLLLFQTVTDYHGHLQRVFLEVVLGRVSQLYILQFKVDFLVFLKDAFQNHCSFLLINSNN